MPEHSRNRIYSSLESSSRHHSPNTFLFYVEILNRSLWLLGRWGGASQAPASRPRLRRRSATTRPWAAVRPVCAFRPRAARWAAPAFRYVSSGRFGYDSIVPTTRTQVTRGFSSHTLDRPRPKLVYDTLSKTNDKSKERRARAKCSGSARKPRLCVERQLGGRARLSSTSNANLRPYSACKFVNRCVTRHSVEEPSLRSFLTTYRSFPQRARRKSRGAP